MASRRLPPRIAYIPKRNLDKARILLVEDEVLPALEIAAAGSDVAALGRMRGGRARHQSGVDNIGESGVAVERSRHTIRHDLWLHAQSAAAAYGDAPLLSKPIQQDLLVSTLQRYIGLDGRDERQPIVDPVESDVPSSADLLSLAAPAMTN